jgi:Niemann-Pick C1 protein
MHAWYSYEGSRLERSLEAVSNIGPAVFNGGFTTFLALALLGFSSSQIFLTFFKVGSITTLIILDFSTEQHSSR